MIDPKCKKCRARSEKLFLKGDRCNTPKCPVIRRQTKPGVHGGKRQRRSRSLSEYGKLLMEKQKIKIYYGIREKQFKKYYKEAAKHKGLTTAILLKKLESRLDNVIYRLGLAPSRSSARQYVNHGYFLVNNRRTASPSYQIKINDIIALNPAKKEKEVIKELKNSMKKFNPPGWLSFDVEKMEAKALSLPLPEQIQSPFDFNTVVEFYSR